VLWHRLYITGQPNTVPLLAGIKGHYQRVRGENPGQERERWRHFDRHSVSERESVREHICKQNPPSSVRMAGRGTYGQTHTHMAREA